MTDHFLFGLEPFGYHFTSYILHIFTTLLVFLFIYRISADPFAAFVCGVLFGIHPLHVESVAWVSERKDVLCAVFYMASLLYYSKYLNGYQKKYFFASLAAHAAALLSKPMAVSVPIVLLLMDFLYRRRFGLSSILEKLPFFLLSISAGLVNIHFQGQAGALKVFARGWDAIYFLTMTPLFYLYKLIFPVNLSAMYIYHDVALSQLLLIPIFTVVLAILFFFTVYSLKYTRKVFFGCLFSLTALLPVLKIIPVGDIFAADRYMYIPSIGLFYVFGIFLSRLRSSGSRAGRHLVHAAFAFIAVFFSVLTWQRIKVWSDPVNFYEKTLKTAPESQVLLNNLGNIYKREGRFGEAEEMYVRSIEIVPEDPGTHYNLGNVQFQQGEVQASIRSFKKALEIRPSYKDAYKSLARSYYKAGLKHKEIEAYQKIIEIDPSDPVPYYNLCLTYRSMGMREKAAYYCRKAAELGMKIPVSLARELSIE
jgi:tetratricopeptide (TPR) repeat protein